MSQDTASPQLLKGISVGTILWIKELADDDDRKRYGLPSNCFKHPCVVVDLAASRKGFVQIYVITSKGNRNVNDVPLPLHVRGRYVPIHPKPTNVLLPGVQLRLAGSAKLRKDSYVNTEKVYTFPLAYLERYSRKQQVSDFCLDPHSIRWLRTKAFGEPLLDTPIKQINTPTASVSNVPISVSNVPISISNVPASTSNIPAYYSPIQNPFPYGAVRASQPQTYIAFTDDELPYSSRSHNTAQTGFSMAGILVVAATAALLVCGIILWR